MDPTTTPSRAGLLRVVGASLIGTTVEWYDFFLYTSAAALVFNKLFFPTADALTGTLLALLTYAVGFLARPVGGLVFGHFGDRVGRKRLLVVSLLMMGGSTFLMGALPTYGAVGVLAPVLLTLLRLVQGFALVITAFILVYVTTGLGMPKETALTAVLVASAVHFVTIPLWGLLSDKIGRKPVYVFGVIGMALWSFGFFWLLDLRTTGAVIGAATIGLVVHGAMYGPQAAFFAEQFPTRVRYTGLSVGGQLSSIAAGAIAPIVAVALFQAYHTTVPVSVYVAAMCVLSLLALLGARETRGESLEEAPAERRSVTA